MPLSIRKGVILPNRFRLQQFPPANRAGRWAGDRMVFEIMAFLALAVWAYLAVGRGGFWRCAERDDGDPPPHRRPGRGSPS